MGVQTMKEQNTFNARNKLGRASDDDGQQVLASRWGRSFSAAAAPFCHETDAFVVASDKTGAMLRTDNGARAWRFKRHSSSARNSARTSRGLPGAQGWSQGERRP